MKPSVWGAAVVILSLTAQGGFIADVLKRHNTYRSHRSVVPAANMQELTWNADLATEATKQARTCKWGHPQGIKYGQNIYKGSETLPQAVSGAMHGWCTEEIGRHAETLKSEYKAGLKAIGRRQLYDHVSQVLWAKTSSVGCGYASCQGRVYLVCNYDPPGNYRGQPWFEAGEACSKCQPDQTCVNGLCRSGDGAGTAGAAAATVTADKTEDAESYEAEVVLVNGKFLLPSTGWETVSGNR